MEQVAKIPDHVTEEEMKGRRDIRDQQLVTIDAIESKDLDDAVTAWKLPNGNYLFRRSYCRCFALCHARDPA